MQLRSCKCKKKRQVAEYFAIAIITGTQTPAANGDAAILDFVCGEEFKGCTGLCTALDE